ncbi:TRAP-type C4-dicarboxylate transport system, small permease component [Lunatimonas lonarensis]|uniref:TRAP-type C4-dicarboxylate transport system, small permease component n=1 Tax=Lunatimonas lonarensis TaxID=1232681 RepID=R7ZMM5_9BACT|nr:TRAP transporter small permease [Lunatimonas lonarensis]EON75264.1 TRAP-type C4-dicarboxylate transport system, small permease component [Lunatimonas lonarensis]
MKSSQPLRFLDRVLSFFTVISFGLMIAVVLLQILARYALPWSPEWTEEMARFCFIYLVSLGAGLALKDRLYVSVDFLLEQLAPAKRKVLEIGILSIIVLLMATMAVVSIPLVYIVRIQQSPAMQFNMALMYASMALMGVFVGIYGVVQLIERIKST